MKRVSFPGDQSGFTLLEVLVAMAVLSMVLVTLLKMQSASARLSEAAYFKNAAPLLARDRLSSMALEGDFRSGGGQFRGSFSGYTWTCEVTPAGRHREFGGLVTAGSAPVQVSMTILGPGKKRRFHVVTWRYAQDD